MNKHSGLLLGAGFILSSCFFLLSPITQQALGVLIYQSLVLLWLFAVLDINETGKLITGLRATKRIVPLGQVAVMMAFSRSKMQLLLLFSTWLFPTLVSCGSLAAWWTDISPAILYQDDQTAGIRYSLCNSNNTPVLPADKTITLPLLKYPPKNGTSLAGTGWWDGKKTVSHIVYSPGGSGCHPTSCGSRATILLFYADATRLPPFSTRTREMPSSTLTWSAIGTRGTGLQPALT